MIQLILSSLFLACSDKDNASDSATENETTDTQDGTDTTDTEEPADPNAPSVIEADAWCYTQGGSTNVDYWAFSATVADPQGVDTIESFMMEGISFELAANGSQVKTIALVCDPSGACTGSEATDTVGVGCIQATDYQATFTISDADGNLSNPLTVPCREGTSAAGK
ncbi:MAG: hypothetical protein VX026_05995 [Myxococcota bacterium]|nr:hypothetical protein [Myxococcota bacterium]